MFDASAMTTVDTAAVHAGREDLAGLGVHVPPIDFSTTNPLPSVADGGDAYETLATGGTLPAGGSAVYQRLWNPTVARFETALAQLEGTAEAVAFASGMAALTATLLAATRDGKRHVVAVRPLYGGTDHVLATGLLGTEVTWARPHEVAAAIRPDTALVVVETPANPTLDLVDIAALATAAGDVPLLVDNTVATPVLQQPARHGAALVLHSATKSIGGHGDVHAGVVGDGHPVAVERHVDQVTGAVTGQPAHPEQLQVLAELLLGHPEVVRRLGDLDAGAGQQVGHQVEQPGQPVRRRAAAPGRRAGHRAPPVTARSSCRVAISLSRWMTASRTSGGSSTRTSGP
ncbi:hypothetical protein GCM10027452_40140 [Micromonospora halotolerans]